MGTQAHRDDSYTPMSNTGSQVSRLSAVRQHNRNRILDYLRTKGPTPRATIARDLHLSRSTVGSIIDNLNQEGFVSEGNKQEATGKGGRRGTRVYFNAKRGYIFGVCIDRLRLRIYLADLMANIIDRDSISFNAERLGGTKGLGIAAEMIQELMKKNDIEPAKIQGIGVSVPGIVSQRGHELVSPPLLKNWFETDIPAFLAKKLRVRSTLICVDNDANLGALGEIRYELRQGRSVLDLVYIKVGIGIGLGRIKNNQIDRGHDGAAGEVGHVIVKYEEADECPSCGRRGCLESVAAQYAIIKIVRERISSLHLKSASSLATDDLDITSIIQAAKEGDHACIEALETAARYIGTVIGSFVMNVLNPEIVIIDGDIIRASERLGDSIFLDCIRRSATGSSLPSNLAVIKTGELGEDAVGLGAIAKAIENSRGLATQPEIHTI